MGGSIITTPGTLLSVPVFVWRECRTLLTQPQSESRIRIRVFVDFWNFQIAVNEQEQDRFDIDWRELGPIVAREALMIVDASASLAYQGMNVYGSYDPNNPNDDGLRRWAANTLNRFPGVQVVMLPRQRKRSGPRCPSCRTTLSICPNCHSDMRGTEEKGVDTRIATDMIKLAWVDDYDVAVLLSSDRDFVPVVEFLTTRGIKTIHGAFPPQGINLSHACWGNVQIPQIMEQFRRT